VRKFIGVSSRNGSTGTDIIHVNNTSEIVRKRCTIIASIVIQ